MKNINTTILVIGIVIISFLCFYFPNKIIEYKNINNNLYKITTNLQIKEEFHDLNFELNNKMTGLVAPNILCKENENNEKYLLELTKGKPLLICKYTYLTCNSCYEAELKLLNNVFIDNTNVVILCSDHTMRNFIIYKRKNEMNISIFSIKFYSFNWIAEKNINSYYFVLHPDMKISHIYVPNKEFPEQNKQYLEGIKRFLSE